MHVFFFCLFLQLSPQSSPSQRSLLPHFIVAHSPLLASAIGRSLISLQISDPQLFPWHEVSSFLFPKPVSNMQQQASLKWWLRAWTSTELTPFQDIN
jgi:hypothetical protein